MHVCSMGHAWLHAGACRMYAVAMRDALALQRRALLVRGHVERPELGVSLHDGQLPLAAAHAAHDQPQLVDV